MIRLLRAILIAGLIVLTSPKGEAVYIAPAQVVAIVPNPPGAPRGAHTEIMLVAGQLYVREPIAEVAAKIQASK